jgi:GDP-L-fucose synthase
MPTNMYGPGDNFDLDNAHVLPALIRRLHEAKSNQAKSVTLWGTGNPKREFLHANDLAAACLFMLEEYSGDVALNVGSGTDVSIKELATLISYVVGYEGEIQWDDTKPDGTPRKLLDVSKINELGWSAKIDLESGIRSTYEWFLKHHA